MTLTGTLFALEVLRESAGFSGLVMPEVPDCGPAFDLLDQTKLWRGGQSGALNHGIDDTISI